jgi:hypothetical protein
LTLLIAHISVYALVTNGASYGSFITDHEGSSSPSHRDFRWSPDPLYRKNTGTSSIAMERGRKLAEAKFQPLDVVPEPL